MPFVVTATFRPSRPSKVELIAAFSTAIAEVHQEAGCELFALHDAADGTLVLIEKWATVEDLDAHGTSGPVQRLNAAIAPHLAEPPVVIRMSALPAGDSDRGVL